MTVRQQLHDIVDIEDGLALGNLERGGERAHASSCRNSCPAVLTSATTGNKGERAFSSTCNTA